MHNKKVVYGSVTVILVLAIASFIPFGKMTQPTTIISKGLWDPEVLNISYLTANADTVAIGRVKEILPSKWSTPDGKKPEKSEKAVIYTDAVIEVQRYLKNPQSESEMVIRTLGGVVDGDTMVVEDEASFEVGERVLVFLTKEDPFTAAISPEHYRVTAWLHGKFRIENGEAIRPALPPEHRRIPLKDLEKAI